MVAGTYERKIDGAPGKLVVTSDGKKIDFSLWALLEYPKESSATMRATVPIVNNCAVFAKKDKTANYTISMRFTGRAVFVLYNGSGFGAGGVDPAGLYIRKANTSLPPADAPPVVRK
jgi:hypothetical protein